MGGILAAMWSQVMWGWRVWRLEAQGWFSHFPVTKQKLSFSKIFVTAMQNKMYCIPMVFWCFLHKELIWSPPEFHSPITGYYQPHDHQVTVLQYSPGRASHSWQAYPSCSDGLRIGKHLQCFFFWGGPRINIKGLWDHVSISRHLSPFLKYYKYM